MDLRRIDRIAHIVSLAVCNVGDEALRLAELTADQFDDIDVFHLVVPTDVVHLSLSPLLKDEVDRFAVILHIQPVADVLPRAVDGERLIR